MKTKTIEKEGMREKEREDEGGNEKYSKHLSLYIVVASGAAYVSSSYNTRKIFQIT